MMSCQDRRSLLTHSLPPLWFFGLFFSSSFSSFLQLSAPHTHSLLLLSRRLYLSLSLHTHTPQITPNTRSVVSSLRPPVPDDPPEPPVFFGKNGLHDESRLPKRRRRRRRGRSFFFGVTPSTHSGFLSLCNPLYNMCGIYWSVFIECVALHETHTTYTLCLTRRF